MIAPDRREGRGRLSSIDTLPEDCEAEIVWALEQLRERTMPQAAILDEFNARLADRGVAGVSKSAFSRWSIRKAIAFRRLDELRAISGDVMAGLGTTGADEVTVAVAELVKAAIYEQLEGGGLDSKSIMELSRGLGAVVAAQKTSADHRRKLEEQATAIVDRSAEIATRSAAEAGLSADRVAQIRRDVLGVRTGV